MSVISIAYEERGLRPGTFPSTVRGVGSIHRPLNLGPLKGGCGDFWQPHFVYERGMSRKQSRSPTGPVCRGARSAHGHGKPNPSNTRPGHVAAKSPAAVDAVAIACRGVLPEWVRQRATSPEGKGSHPNSEPAHGPTEFLTVAEAAALWRVSVRTLRRRIAAGEVPHIRIGRQVRIPRAGVVREP